MLISGESKLQARGNLANRNREIERKFLILDPPSLSDAEGSILIRQGYITSGEALNEVRVRQIGSEYLLGVKSGGGIERTEVEIPLELEQFTPLWTLTEGWRLEKRRFFFPFRNHRIELDVYAGHIAPLMVAEVEFDTIEESSRFEPPGWFGTEISGVTEYRNSRLARYGFPAPKE